MFIFWTVPDSLNIKLKLNKATFIKLILREFYSFCHFHFPKNQKFENFSIDIFVLQCITVKSIAKACFILKIVNKYKFGS